EWIWNRTQEIFPGATEIVDLYHARHHLWDLSSKLHPSDVAAKRRWVMSHQHFLDDGKIELLVNRLRALGTERQELAEEIETEASYFERNAARMRYPKIADGGFLAEWWPWSARLVIGKKWHDGIHCHDYKQALKVIEDFYRKKRH